MAIIKKLKHMNTEEGNISIAKFMGGRYITVHSCIATGPANSKDTVYTPIDDLKYHSSWDWLMPVIEKIVKNKELLNKPCNTLGYEKINFQLEYDGYYRKWDSIIYGELFYWDEKAIGHTIEIPHKRIEGKTNIEAAYLAVVQFIKWYNQKKNKLP
jgi:hypothetical protein